MRVLFLGEGDITGPARYLAAILKWSRFPFDHRPDQSRLPKAWRAPNRYDVIILSDYRYSSWTPCAKEWLIKEVRENGTGLLMIGGWASFTGLVGGYAGTAIEELLPVRCIPGDDRVNWASGSIIQGVSDAPVVCGYHRATPKAGMQVKLQLRDLTIGSTVRLGKPHPLLVTGAAGIGRTAAFLTDCAPHWAGGLVDWGRRRIKVRLNAATTVEVGNQYLSFFKTLIHSLAPKE